MYYQTTGFLLLCALAAAVVLCLAYVLHIRRLTDRVAERMRVRQAERDRIAADFHDTVLQSVYSLMLRIQTAMQRLPASHFARQELEHALELADRVMADGRDRVAGLRGPGDRERSLADGLKEALSEARQRTSAHLALNVCGSSLPLRADVRDQMLLVGREAILNAAQHAKARSIEVELAYSASEALVRVCDDGSGIAEHLLEGDVAHAGHWGLGGMRRRAADIGGRLDIVNIHPKGTSVELSVPALSAYAADRRRNPLMRRFYPGAVKRARTRELR